MSALPVPLARGSIRCRYSQLELRQFAHQVRRTAAAARPRRCRWQCPRATGGCRCARRRLPRHGGGNLQVQPAAVLDAAAVAVAARCCCATAGTVRAGSRWRRGSPRRRSQRRIALAAAWRQLSTHAPASRPRPARAALRRARSSIGVDGRALGGDGRRADRLARRRAGGSSARRARCATAAARCCRPPRAPHRSRGASRPPARPCGCPARWGGRGPAGHRRRLGDLAGRRAWRAGRSTAAFSAVGTLPSGAGAHAGQRRHHHAVAQRQRAQGQVA